MADYIAQSDLDVYLNDDDLVQLTDDDGDGIIDSSVVAECIVAAEAEVNTYLAKQYTTPITGVIPEPVKEWSVQLATLRLHQRRLPVPPDVWEMARDARRQLNMIAKGDISLDIGSSGATVPSGLEPQFEFNERGFTRSKFSGW